MKKPIIRRIVAVAALAVGFPLVAIGMKGFTSLPGVNGRNTLEPSLADNPAGKRYEIQLKGGTGQDIQRALLSLPAHGGRVMLSAGTYIVSEPLVMDRDNVELAGDQELTILKLNDRVNCPLLVVGQTSTPPQRTVNGITVRKLVLDGNRFAQDFECFGGACDQGGISHIRNNALTIRGAEDIRIEHVTARAARSGGVVLEKGCRRINISDFTSHDNHFDGFAAYETEESVFTRLYLHSNAAAGISADIAFNRNIISHTRLERNGSQGIFMRDSNFNNFSHLTIRENGQQGIFLAQDNERENTACTGNVFSKLTVTGSKGFGFRVNDITCIANTIASSLFKANGEGAISEVSEKIIAQVGVSVE